MEYFHYKSKPSGLKSVLLTRHKLAACRPLKTCKKFCRYTTAAVAAVAAAWCVLYRNGLLRVDGDRAVLVSLVL